MPMRPCLTCGQLTRSGSYCPAHGRPWIRRSPSSLATDRPAWKRVRAFILARDGYRCGGCGSSEGLEVHHVVPVAEGGTDDPANCVTACRRCHRGAHRSARIG